MAIDTVTSKIPGQASSDAEFRQAVKELKDTYARLGVKLKGKERALLGLGLPRAAIAVASGIGTTGVGSSAVAGGNVTEEGEEMSVG
jgi:anaphase-promoting complex subunit 6